MLREAYMWRPMVDKPTKAKKTLISSYLHMLAWLDHRERSHTLDARMARDTGSPCGLNGRFGSFRLDPRPFWGIGSA